MKLVALLQVPKDLEVAVKALAEHAALAPAEARMRLAPEPPALLARLDDPAAAELVARLRAVGVAALSCDAAVPTDAQRTVARTFAISDRELRLTPRSGKELALPWGEIILALRGMRVSRQTTTRTETERKFSMKTALVTQGLKMTSTTRREVRTSSEEAEHFLLVYDSMGRCGAIYDSQVAFACLGPKLQPSQLANMNFIAAEVSKRLARARYDDRLLRLARRPLPFVAEKGIQLGHGEVATTRSEGASTADVLAELMFRGAIEGLLARG